MRVTRSVASIAAKSASRGFPVVGAMGGREKASVEQVPYVEPAAVPRKTLINEVDTSYFKANASSAAAVPEATSKVPRETRPRVVILGTGWGGITLATFLDKTKFDVRIVSPANHFLFTPLLPSTAVGTLEFRAIQEPVRRACPGISEYYQAKAKDLSTEDRTVRCEDLYTQRQFDLRYDYLVVATGSKTNTFKTPGVEEREGRDVFFLKHLHHARQIRNRVIECFERASNPTISQQERKRLLSFVIVGAGPTSCEFTTELSDFIRDDVEKWYPQLTKSVKITVLERANDILGPFDASLRSYYQQFLEKRGIEVVTGVGAERIEEMGAGSSFDLAFTASVMKEFKAMDLNGDGVVDAEEFASAQLKKKQEEQYDDLFYEYDVERRPRTVSAGPLQFPVVNLSNGDRLPFGMLVWSAGLTQVKFVEQSDLPRERSGRVTVDKFLRVPGCQGRVFSLGDCASDPEAPLPATAQVAEQQGQYLADCFNQHYASFDPNSKDATPTPGPVVPSGMPFRSLRWLDSLLYTASPSFTFVERGKMASMGFGRAIAQLDMAPRIKGKSPCIKGASAFVAWRGAYLTKQVSWKNRILILMFWLKTGIFGRDISRF